VLVSFLRMPRNLKSLLVSLPLDIFSAPHGYIQTTVLHGSVRLDLLDLFFNPLFALLILFLECEIFDFGTASTMGGNSSSKDARPGMDRYHAGVAIVERKIAGVGKEDRRKDWT